MRTDGAGLTDSAVQIREFHYRFGERTAPGFGASLAVTAGCAALAFGAAVWLASRRPAR